MNRWSMVLLAAAVSSVIAGAAQADSIGAVIVKNPGRSAVTVEWRVGPSKDCASNHDFTGTQSIPGGDKWQLTVRNEGIACVRIKDSGKAWWWNKATYGKVFEYIVEH